jgi:hypothetical protein
MTTRKSSHFSPKAIQAVAANIDTLHKVQFMLSVHDNVVATAGFSKDNLATIIDPDVEYYEFNKPIMPEGIAGVAQRFAEFNETFGFGQINNLLTFGDGEYLANVYEVEATHVGTHDGVAATNKKVKVPGIGVMKIQNGKITEYYDAYDVGGLLPQVAAAPARADDWRWTDANAGLRTKGLQRRHGQGGHGKDVAAVACRSRQMGRRGPWTYGNSQTSARRIQTLTVVVAGGDGALRMGTRSQDGQGKRLAAPPRSSRVTIRPIGVPRR